MVVADVGVRDSYRATLKRIGDDWDDPEGLLAKCHKRCAERYEL